MTNETRHDDPIDTVRSKYGFWIVIIGFGVVLAVFIFSIEKWTDAKDVTAAVGAVTGVVGTLAGAFFGVHVGAEGKEKADRAAAEAQAKADQAQAKVERLAALMPPGDAARALNIN
jgi:uncharacterized membrane protein